MNEKEETPTRVETVWGVELDDFGSVDYYPTEDEAREAASSMGAPLVKAVYEFWGVSA